MDINAWFSKVKHRYQTRQIIEYLHVIIDINGDVMNGRSLLMVSGGLILTFLVMAGCAPSYSSNGERIYYIAAGSSREPISHSGSISMMHPIGCVNCHGTDGKGGGINMMMWGFETPDITWDHLTSDVFEDHGPYTEDTIRLAITQGVDPAGEPLDEEMPRWNISKQDMDDLIEYLKNLN